jgi:hypothetical protein
VVAEFAGVVQARLEARRPFGRAVADAVALRIVRGTLVGGYIGAVLDPVVGVVLPLVDTVFGGEHPGRIARVGQVTRAVGRHAVVDGVLVERVVRELRGDAQALGDEVQVVAQLERSLQVAARTFAETGAVELPEHVVAVVVVGIEQVAAVLLEIGLVDVVVVVGQDDRQVGGLRVGQRDDVGRRGARIVVFRYAGAQVDRDLQPLGGVDIDVGAEVIAQELVDVVGVRVLVVAALVVVAAEDEITGAVGAASYRKAVILEDRRFECVVEVIPVVAQAVGVVALGAAEVADRLLGEERCRAGIQRGVVVEHRLVVEGRIACRTQVVGVADRFADTDRRLEIDGRLFALSAALGRDDDHAVGAADTVGCRCRSILEDRERLDLVRGEVAHVALDAVDDHDDVRLAVGRFTANVELRGVVTRFAAVELVDQQARHAPGQRIVDVGRGGLLEVFGGDRRDRTGDGLLLLHVVTYHHDLFERLAVLDHRDVDPRAVVYAYLLRGIADVGDHQRRFGVGNRDCIAAVGVRYAARGGAFDDDGHADQRASHVILDDTRDLQLRGTRLSVRGGCRPVRRGRGGPSQTKQTQYQCYYMIFIHNRIVFLLGFTLLS